jgi:hypothetical protein
MVLASDFWFGFLAALVLGSIVVIAFWVGYTVGDA